MEIRKHKAKKSLGQNFLNNDHIAEQIVDSAKLTERDTVLEVGPGKGMLTVKLLAKAGRVVAIEKDNTLIPLLNEVFAGAIEVEKLALVHADILDCDLSTHNIQTGAFKLVANIPYYITGLLFRKFLEEGPQPTEMIVMVQKEVADRIMARDGRESILSISVKVFGTPSIVVRVGAGNFTPAPTIDSAVLKISGISKDFFNRSTGKLDEKAFFNLLRAGFAHKRKHLLGNLLTVGIKTRSELEVLFEKFKLLPSVRPENLTAEDWRSLALEIL